MRGIFCRCRGPNRSGGLGVFFGLVEDRLLESLFGELGVLADDLVAEFDDRHLDAFFREVLYCFIY